MNYPEMVSILPMPDRLVVIGDIHGDLEKLKTTLNSYGLINKNDEWIANPPNTIVVQMGDQVDSQIRGGDPYNQGNPNNSNWETYVDVEVVVYMYNLDLNARKFGGRVISLIGNHELMNTLGDFSYVSQHSMFKTGGLDRRSELFSPGGDVAMLLSQRPMICMIGDIIFVHAGLISSHLDIITTVFQQNNIEVTPANIISVINSESNKFFRKEPIIKEIFMPLVLDSNGIIWTREYSNTLFTEPSINDVLIRMNAGRIIVGHTVVENIQAILNGKIWFVDIGLSRAFSDKTNIQILNIFKQ